MNRVILMGRIVHDLELKTTSNGLSVLQFRMAVDRNYQAKGEERKSDFINCRAWRHTAEFINRYFGKGRMILVEGELQVSQYTDKNNNPATWTEVVVNQVYFTGEPKNAGQTNTYSNAPYQGNAYPPQQQAQAPSNTYAAPQAMSQGSAEDFVEKADDDEYPF